MFQINYIKKLTILDYLIITFMSILILMLWFNIIFVEFINYSDNFYYNKAYEGLSGSSIPEAYNFFVWRTAGTEPLSFLLFYTFSNLGFSYSTFIYILDFFLIFLLFSFYIKSRINYLLSFFFISSNFYFIVLSIGVHRLKIAMIFFLIVLLINNRFMKKLFSLLSLLSHFQILIFYLLDIFSNFISRIISLKISFRVVFGFIFLLIFTLILSQFTLLFSKFISRIDLHYFDLIKSLILVTFFIFMFNIKVKKELIYLFSLTFLVLLIGGFRVNIMIYFIFIIILAKVNNEKFLLFNFIISPYMMYKTINLYYGHYLSEMIYD